MPKATESRPRGSAQPPRRPPGRPRLAGTEAEVLRAAAQLLVERGIKGTSLAGVAARAGVARATVYRRWPTRDALIGATVKAVAAGRPFPLSGDIAGDIERGAAFMERIFGDPVFPAILPELVRGLLARPPDIAFDAVAPNRVAFAAEFRDLAATQGFEADVDPMLPFDLLFGAAISHVLATGSPPSSEYLRQAGAVIIEGLRTRRTAGRGVEPPAARRPPRRQQK